jgi:hypothetical protein
LLFSWFGYQLLIDYLQNDADSKLEKKLDEDNYDSSQLVAIKIPATSLPYYTNSKQFQRTNGQIELNGSTYNYVKWRLYQDTVELFCIPNRVNTKLSTARDDFFKLVNDLQHNSSSKKAVYNSLNDYRLPDFIKLHLLSFEILTTHAHCPHYISFEFSPVIENPPEFC